MRLFRRPIWRRAAIAKWDEAIHKQAEIGAAKQQGHGAQPGMGEHHADRAGLFLDHHVGQADRGEARRLLHPPHIADLIGSKPLAAVCEADRQSLHEFEGFTVIQPDMKWRTVSIGNAQCHRSLRVARQVYLAHQRLLLLRRQLSTLLAKPFTLITRAALMPAFRVHFENGVPLDVEADTPKQAEKEAGRVRPDVRIRKIKLVREGGDRPEERTHAR